MIATKTPKMKYPRAAAGMKIAAALPMSSSARPTGPQATMPSGGVTHTGGGSTVNNAFELIAKPNWLLTITE